MPTGRVQEASSATTGFFQEYPVISPAYTSQGNENQLSSPTITDTILNNIIALYLPKPLPPSIDQNLHNFARECLDPSTLRLNVDCEINQPKLHPLTTFGQVNDIDPLWTSEGWRTLKAIQTQAGCVAHGYKPLLDTPPYNIRVHQFLLDFMWGPSSGGVTCPAAMSDGAAILLRRHLERAKVTNTTGQDEGVLRRVLQEAFDRLTSFDPGYAWTSGQWMTERAGGSDVSRTESLGHLGSADELKADVSRYGTDVDSVGMPLGPYFVNGFKWFSSATDTEMVVLLAQTGKGLSTFYAPLKRRRVLPNGRQEACMNGVRISRLKNKLGTKGLPTAELEIKGMRAWLLGEEGKGVREISAILNATRLWTASGATSGWARGLAVSRSYSMIRKIKGDLRLSDNSQHLKWMADETVKFRAYTHFAFLGVALFGLSEHGWERTVKGTKGESWLPRDSRKAEMLLRILTPVMKARCSLAATLGLRECMESLGGVGYCENSEDGGTMNVARMFRDSAVNSIWEGTTNILAEDLIRAAKGAQGVEALRALDEMLHAMLDKVGSDFARLSEIIQKSWNVLRSQVRLESTEHLLYVGRDILVRLQDIVCAFLLLIDAATSAGDAEISIAKRWLGSRFPEAWNDFGDGTVSSAYASTDKLIFLGVPDNRVNAVSSKL